MTKTSVARVDALGGAARRCYLSESLSEKNGTGILLSATAVGPSIAEDLAAFVILSKVRTPASRPNSNSPRLPIYPPSGASLRLLRSLILVLHRSQTKNRSVDPAGSEIGPCMKILRPGDWVQFGQRGLPTSKKRGAEGRSVMPKHTLSFDSPRKEMRAAPSDRPPSPQIDSVPVRIR